MHQQLQIRNALSLCFTLGMWGVGAAGYAQGRTPPGVAVVHLPVGASTRPSAAGVCHYVLGPPYRNNTEYYLTAADTTATPLLEGPAYGLYYAGKGQTSHSPSRYQVVYWLGPDLFWVEDLKDWPTQRKVLTQWFKAVGFRIDGPARQRVQAKVKSMIKKNRVQVDGDVF